MAETPHELRVKCCYKMQTIPLSVPPGANFGQVKGLVCKETGLSPEHFKILFRGREKGDGDAVCAAGVKDGSKLHVVETEEFKKRRGEELAAQGAIEKAEVVEEPSPSPMEGDAPGSLPDTPTLPREAPGGPGSAEARLVSQISAISSEVDELSSQVEDLAGVAGGDSGEDGKAVDLKQCKVLTELLTQKLLKLDVMDVSGDLRQSRRELINRINRLCDQLEALKQNAA